MILDMRILLASVILVPAAVVLTGCPLTSPDSEKRVQSQAQVPGLNEAVIAKDRAIKATIELSWASDPELLQEQLAVEDVQAGKVRITGIVSRPELKERAEAIVGKIDGVSDVVSTISVDESLKDKRINLDESF